MGGCKFFQGNHDCLENISRKKSTPSFQYDLNGNRILQSDITGKSTSYTYNALDLLEEIRDNGFYAYDSCGNPVKKSRLDSKTMQTYSYGYDSAGRITSETDPEGNTTTYSYATEFALYSTMKNAEGTEIRYTYDKAGRNMAVEHESGTFRYGYNDADFVTKEEDEEGNATRYDYDRMCNLIRRTEPNFKDSKNTADCLTRYEYDNMDCLLREISPMGRVKAFVNDSEGNITKETTPTFMTRQPKTAQAYSIPMTMTKTGYRPYIRTVQKNASAMMRKAA